MKVLGSDLFLESWKLTNSYFTSSFTSWPRETWGKSNHWATLDPFHDGKKSHLRSGCSKGPKEWALTNSPRLGECYRIRYCYSTATSPADGKWQKNIAESYAGAIENYCKKFCGWFGIKITWFEVGFLDCFFALFLPFPRIAAKRNSSSSMVTKLETFNWRGFPVHRWNPTSKNAKPKRPCF